jgi:nicotinate phosphoribosyltransferase
MRMLDATGTADAEVVSASPPRGDVHAVPDEPEPPGGRHPRSDGRARRMLLRQLVKDGEIVGAEPLGAARERHKRALLELPRAAQRLSSGDPVIPTVIRPARENAGNGSEPDR